MHYLSGNHIVVKGVMSIYDHIAQTPGPSDVDVKQGFYEVQQKLDEISNQLNAIIDLVTDKGIKNQYATAEYVITTSLDKNNQFTNVSSPEASDLKRQDFLDFCKSKDLEGAIDWVMQGMLGLNSVGGDILEAIRQTYKVIIVFFQNIK